MKTTIQAMFFSFLRWCPGALGLFLRQKCMPYYFKKCGRGVVFGRFLSITNPQNISIDSRCVLADRVTLSADDSVVLKSLSPEIKLGYGSFVGVGSMIRCGVSSVLIDDGVSIGSNCIIDAGGDVHIEEKALLAAYCSIGQRRASGKSRAKQKIIIGKGSWLGARVSVFDGVLIGKGCVVGAHGCVENDLPDLAVAAGQPAVIVRFRDDRGKKTNGI